mgnify:FL=1
MLIAVNTRLQKNQQPDGYESFMFGILQNLSNKYAQHHFIFIFDRPYDTNIGFAKNVLPIIAGPQTTNSLHLQYWLNFKVPKILRQHNADVFVNLEGMCCLRTKIPQCLLITGYGLQQDMQLQKKWLAAFYKKKLPIFFSKAKSIVAVSEFVKLGISNQYGVDTKKIGVLHPAIAKIYKPAGWKEQEIIKEKYAAGKAYFLFSGNINENSNHINLLKAFSFFKARQKTNMLLLIAGKPTAKFANELSTYKWRNHIKLFENLT